MPKGCYRLTAGELILGMRLVPVVIQGSGPGGLPCDGSGTVIDAQGTSTVMSVAGGEDATVTGVTLTGGQPVPGFSGGGISISTTGRLTLGDAVVAGNSAGAGADGVAPGSTGGTGANGGGIFVGTGATLGLTGSTVSGNAAGAGGLGADTAGSGAGGVGGAGGNGGGIYMSSGSHVTLTGSTLSGNAAGAGGIGGIGDETSLAGGGGGAGGTGGGVDNAGGTLTMTNVTIAGNTAGAGGSGALGTPRGQNGAGGAAGGIRDTGTVSASYVTVTGNSGHGVGDGIDEAGGSMTETGSVVAGNGTQNCTGGFVDGGGNVTDTSGLTSCPGLVGDPKLGSLASNGGPTQTVALGPGSAAIDLVASGAASCGGVDQRGLTRPQGAGCDAGAYESGPPALTAISAQTTGPSTAVVSGSVTANFRDSAVTVRYGPTTAYGSQTTGQDVGAGTSPVAARVVLTGLAPATTYHAQLLATNGDGSTASSDLVFTTAAGPPGLPGGPGVARSPTVSGFRQSAPRWVAGPALARLSATRRKHKLPVGTTFSFGLSPAASVRLSFTQTLSGRTVNGHCVAPGHRHQRTRACSRTVLVGSLQFAGHAGTDRVSFAGHLSRRRTLAPGAYTVTIVATNAGGRSLPRRVSFTIVGKQAT